MSWTDHTMTVKVEWLPEPWVTAGTVALITMSVWLIMLSALTLKMVIAG